MKKKKCFFVNNLTFNYEISRDIRLLCNSHLVWEFKQKKDYPDAMVRKKKPTHIPCRFQFLQCS